MIKPFLRKVKNVLNPPKDYPLRKGMKHKFIFIHINKTGGLSVANAIGLPEKRELKRHMTVMDVINIIGQKKFDSAFVFTTVRNPWSKVVSHYKYRVKTNQCKMAENQISFKDWVKCTYGPNKDPFYYNTPKMFSQQVEWLKNKEGKIVVKNIIKFENLAEDYKKIAEIIGTTPELPHINATRKDDYRTYYNEETKQIIADWFAEDIKLFRYTFDQ